MITTRTCIVALLLGLPLTAAAADPKEKEKAPAGECTVSPDPVGPHLDLGELIARVAKRTGKQFVIDPRVRAQVPVGTIDLERLDLARLLTILRVNYFAAYESGGVVNVVPDAGARQFPIPVSTSLDQKLDDEWVSVLVQGKNVCAAHTVPILRPLMPQAAHLAAVPQTNTLVISDHADNARRIVDMFQRLDAQAAGNKGCRESVAKSSPN